MRARRRTPFRWSAALAALVALAACAEGPEDTATSERTKDADATPAADATDIVIPPPPPGSGLGASSLTWDAPDGWIAERPETSMRRAQYRIAGVEGDAQLVVFYFGPGQGGDPMANIQRWAHQFEPTDGASPFEAMVVKDLEAAPVPVTVVEIAGTYRGSMGSGPETALEDQMLLGAIAEGPDAPWFFKMTGPRETVAAQRQAFEELLRSLRAGS